jgi:predicted HAD superfamily Cof-like phosphohydrolase
MTQLQGTNFELVGDFMEAMDQEIQIYPVFPDEHIQNLRVDLIEEEFDELRDGIEAKDIVEVADALTDLLYVIYGAGHAFGIDLDECFNEVHLSNMSKLGEDGRVIKREDGKVMKPNTYFPPDIASVLATAITQVY